MPTKIQNADLKRANLIKLCKENWPDLDEATLLVFALRALLALTVDKRPDNNFPVFTDEALRNEKWKLIDEHPNCFISNFGRLRGGITGHSRIRKQSMQTGGYAVVLLTGLKGKKQFQVSRLVAEAFIRKPQQGEVLNHINGNKLDNRACNIEWTSQDKNVAHSNSTGLRNRPSKLFGKYTKDEHEEIRAVRSYFAKSMLAKIYGIKSSEIDNIIESPTRL